MRKLYGSLPAGTLAVNFDDSIKRGYRRRGKRRKFVVGAPSPEPALGSGF